MKPKRIYISNLCLYISLNLFKTTVLKQCISIKKKKKIIRKNLEVQKNMARIAGVDLPKEKRVEIALTYIYGIGL